jgi:hypothetical protein
LFNLVGTPVGALIPSLMVEDNVSIDIGKKQTFNFILTEFIIVLSSCILVFIFIKDKPICPVR